MTIPVAIYADFEAIHEPINDGGLRKTVHKVLSAQFYAECNKSQCMEWSYYVGYGDVVQKFLDELYIVHPKLSDMWITNRKTSFGKVRRTYLTKPLNVIKDVALNSEMC